MVRRSKAGRAANASRRTVRRGVGLDEDYQALVRHIWTCGNGSANTARAIGLTSCGLGAGVSTIAGNLAVAAARASPGQVLLVDANLARPSLPQRFGVQPTPGLVDALGGKTAPLDCVQDSPVENLLLLAAGTSNRQAEPDYDLSAMEELLRIYKGEFPTIVVELPPVAGTGVCHPLVGSLDGVIFVVEAERTDGRTALHAKQQLVEANANLLGVVFNKRRMHIPGWLYRML